MKKMNSATVAWAALIIAVIALIKCIACCVSMKSGSSVEAALMAKPEIIVNAMQNFEQKMRDEAVAQAKKLIEEHIENINNNPRSPVLGNPNGSIVLAEFFDFACGYCQRLRPAIKNIIKNNPEVKFVAKELSFVSPASNYAARAALAAHKQGKYEQMYDALLSLGVPLTEAKVDEIARSIGLDMAKFKADVDSQEIHDTVRENNELAGKIQIQGVPTIVLNGEMIQTIDESVLQEAINALK